MVAKRVAKRVAKQVAKRVAKRLENGWKTVAVIARFGRPNAANPDTLYSLQYLCQKEYPCRNNWCFSQPNPAGSFNDAQRFNDARSMTAARTQ